jgi:hypothetical protein
MGPVILGNHPPQNNHQIAKIDPEAEGFRSWNTPPLGPANNHSQLAAGHLSQLHIFQKIEALSAYLTSPRQRPPNAKR